MNIHTRNFTHFGIQIRNLQSQCQTELEEKSSALRQDNEKTLSKIQEEIDQKLSEEEVEIR